MQTYAIGDIHGQYEALRAAHDRIEADRQRHGDADAPVIHMGDLTDRGPDSRGVLDHLIGGIAAGQPWQVVQGNHDRMFAGFMADADYHDAGLRKERWWTHPRVGGDATLASYGVMDTAERDRQQIHAEAVQAVDPTHPEFLRTRPTHLSRGGLLFVHAGIRPGVPLDQQTEDDLLWIRDDFHADPRDHGALIVHGHTPVDQPTHYGNRVNIDTGAGHGHPLTAVVIEGTTVFVLTDGGRKELRPAG